MQTTSLEAYAHIQDKLQPREKEVIEVLSRMSPMCDRDMAKALDWEINMLTGRRNSLVKKGVVVEAYKSKSYVTGKTVIYWMLKPKQQTMFREFGDER